jgi:Zn-dependent M28 family amino/carboxypeptidase
VLRKAGLDLQDLERRAVEPGFQPVPVPGLAFSADYRVRRDRLVVRNVLARLPGAGAEKETVIYSARRRAVDAGASDNGTGLAALLELARVYAHTPPTRRSLVFAAFADDPRGHFGADWYLQRPLYPLASTAADIDIAALQTAGPAHDLLLADARRSTLADALDRAAARQGRRVTLRPRSPVDPAWGADPSPFARRGVPVLPVAAMSGGPDLAKGGRSAASSRARDWDLRGAALDLALLYDVGRDVANSSAWPHWTPGSMAMRRETGRTNGR